MQVIPTDIQDKVKGYLGRASNIKEKQVPALEARLNSLAVELESLHRYPLPQKQFDNIRAFADCIKISTNIIEQFLKRLDLYITGYNNESCNSADASGYNSQDDYLLFRILTRSKNNEKLGLCSGYMSHLIDPDLVTFLGSFTDAIEVFRDTRIPISKHCSTQELNDQDLLSRIQGSLSTSELFEFTLLQKNLKSLVEDLQNNLEAIIDKIPGDKAKKLAGLSPAGFYYSIEALYLLLDHFQASALLDKSRNRLIDHRYQYNPDIAADLDAKIDYLFDDEAEAEELRLRKELEQIDKLAAGRRQQFIDYGIADYNLDQLRATGFDFDHFSHLFDFDDLQGGDARLLQFMDMLMQYNLKEIQEGISQRSSKYRHFG